MDRLVAAFSQLPDRCREVVWMRRIENLPQKQIAARLGIAESTVEKHLVRGVALLADAFQGGAGGSTDSDAGRENLRPSRSGKG
jgi:DNA-directed RNA polymerase specialized sigma24 family protein